MAAATRTSQATSEAPSTLVVPPSPVTETTMSFWPVLPPEEHTAGPRALEARPMTKEMPLQWTAMPTCSSRVSSTTRLTSAVGNSPPTDTLTSSLLASRPTEHIVGPRPSVPATTMMAVASLQTILATRMLLVTISTRSILVEDRFPAKAHTICSLSASHRPGRTVGPVPMVPPVGTKARAS